MLHLYTRGELFAAHGGRTGLYFELSPGPDANWSGGDDSACFYGDDWDCVAEPILADKLPGYDRCGRVCVGEESWIQPLDYIDDLCSRLKRADLPALLYVEASDLPLSLVRHMEQQHPARRDELVSDLETLVAWCRVALRRWHAITIIGL